MADVLCCDDLSQAIILHSGEDVDQYSDPVFDFLNYPVSSFKLGPPPDVYQGYGSVRLSNVLPLPGGGGLDPDLHLVFWDRLNMTARSTLMWEVTVLNNKTHKPLKLTTAWFDPPAIFMFSAVLLLHDLDLLVVGPDGSTHWGNRVEGGDVHNPNEQVYIHDPACYNGDCVYSVYLHVNGLSEWSNTQTVALVVTSSGVLRVQLVIYHS